MYIFMDDYLVHICLLVAGHLHYAYMFFFSLMIDYLSDQVIRGCGSKRCVVYDCIIIICLIVARHLHSAIFCIDIHTR